VSAVAVCSVPLKFLNMQLGVPFTLFAPSAQVLVPISSCRPDL
jgi:hypothetical protein